MRKRRKEKVGVASAALRRAASLGQLLWHKVTRHPVDSIAILLAIVGCAVIVVNALVLQSGSRPAPFLVNAPPPVSPAPAKRAEAPPRNVVEVTATTHAIPAERNDPIGQLISTSSRVAAVQRVLSDYGFGQIKRSGTLDPPTVAAIEKFEREHKLPVTGRITDRLLSDLAAMAGHAL